MTVLIEFEFFAVILATLFVQSNFSDPRDHRSWKDQHPQSRGQILYSNRVFSVHQWPAYKLSCYSCMSPYLEDQFQFISHLYRRPHAFTEKCDFNNFDGKYMRTRNCTDLCVSLRMNDKVGGRRRFGYMRGCMSDIIHYNRSIVRDYPGCYSVRLRDLFVSSDRYAFEPHDQVELCPCHKQYCNGSTKPATTPYFLIALSSFFLLLFSYLNNNCNLNLYFSKSCKSYHFSSYPLSSSSEILSRQKLSLSSKNNCNAIIKFNDLESLHRRISQKMVLEIGVS